MPLGAAAKQRGIEDLSLRRGEAEAEGFEPPERCRSTVFKTAAIDHSATPPWESLQIYVYSALISKKNGNFT